MTLIKTLVVSLISGAVLCFASASGAAGQSQRPSVVLVHGAFADGSSWNEVIRRLQQLNFRVVSVQNPIESLEGDSAATRRVIDNEPGPVVLVGHSWGGAVITEAGDHPKVRSLVYAAAFAPDAGESVSDLLAQAPPAQWLNNLVADSAGFLTLDVPGFLQYFASDLSRGHAKALWSVQVPGFAGTLDEQATHAAWRVRPTWYVIAENDQFIDPTLQARMASAMGAHVSTVSGGHLIPITHPDAIVRAIAEAALAR